MAARQGARDADRHRSAEGRLGQSNKLAAAVCNHRVARAACRRQASAGAGAHAKIQRELRRIYSSVGAGKNRHLQDHLVIGEGWIDVVQDGRRVQSLTSTGVKGCDGVRKSVKFELAAVPFTVQLSNVEANSVGLVISSE